MDASHFGIQVKRTAQCDEVDVVDPRRRAAQMFGSGYQMLYDSTHVAAWQDLTM